jgi:peroxiredoxin
MKKQLIFSFLAVFVCLCAFLIFKIQDKLAHQKIKAEQIKRLPDLLVFDLDSSCKKITEFVKVKQKTVLIFFNSTCEHCQYEASEIQKHLNQFEQVNLLMISSENLSTIHNFAKIYSLQPTAKILKSSASEIFNHFGSIGFPSIFVYDTHGNLEKQFKGEVKMDLLITNE